jgi:hypothetical protein
MPLTCSFRGVEPFYSSLYAGIPDHACPFWRRNQKKSHIYDELGNPGDRSEQTGGFEQADRLDRPHHAHRRRGLGPPRGRTGGGSPGSPPCWDRPSWRRSRTWIPGTSPPTSPRARHLDTPPNADPKPRDDYTQLLRPRWQLRYRHPGTTRAVEVSVDGAGCVSFARASFA